MAESGWVFFPAEITRPLLASNVRKILSSDLPSKYQKRSGDSTQTNQGSVGEETDVLPCIMLPVVPPEGSFSVLRYCRDSEVPDWVTSSK